MKISIKGLFSLALLGGSDDAVASAVDFAIKYLLADGTLGYALTRDAYVFGRAGNGDRKGNTIY